MLDIPSGKLLFRNWKRLLACTVTTLKPDIYQTRKSRIGIMPIGALSMAFTNYIRGVDMFIESGRPRYGVGKKLKIAVGGEIKEINLSEENYTDTISLLALSGKMPEVILFSPPNHRLMLVIEEVIKMIRMIANTGYLTSKDDINRYIPKFVMLSNGIYYDEVMRCITKSFKSIGEDIVEELKGNFVRATTLQTGDRIGRGAEAVYKSGPKEGVTLAGGSKEVRNKIIALLKKYDYPVFETMGVEVRRVEFDKAIGSLSANGVQISLIVNNEGKLRSLTLGDLVSDREMQEKSKKIVYTMVSIGVKAGIYKKPEKGIQQEQLIDTISQEIWRKLKEKSKIDSTHIISSVAVVGERYRLGILENKLPTLEENIINYLLNLAKENNMEEEKKVIENLRDSIMQNIEKLTHIEKDTNESQ